MCWSKRHIAEGFGSKFVCLGNDFPIGGGRDSLNYRDDSIANCQQIKSAQKAVRVVLLVGRPSQKNLANYTSITVRNCGHEPPFIFLRKSIHF